MLLLNFHWAWVKCIVENSIFVVHIYMVIGVTCYT